MKAYDLLKSYVPVEFKQRSKSVMDQLKIHSPFPSVHELNKPVFVIGSVRSGTTKLANTLGKLPDFKTLIEHSIIRETAWRIAEMRSFDDKNWEVFRRLLIKLSGVTETKRLLEKCPANSLLSCFIGDHANEAIFIHSIRDGRDAALSMFDHSYIERQLLNDYPEKFWWNYVDKDFINRWNDITFIERALLKWGVLFKYACKAARYDHRYFEIHYEKLCYNPEYLIEFVEKKLGVSKITNDFYNEVKTYSPRSVGRYKSDTGFTAIEQKTFEDIAARIGYKC